MSPLVSVVIPAYNNAEYITAAVDSVLTQSFTDFELIIADHDSSDATWELLQRYASHPAVRLLQTPGGGGAEANWNRVSQAATGDLIKLVCGDDLLYPDSLLRQVEGFDGPGSDVVMVASSRDFIDARGRIIVRNQGLRRTPLSMGGPEAVRRSVLAGTNIFGEPCCVMMRRSALEQVGYWQGRRGYLIDQATYAQVLFTGDFAAVRGPLSAFRISATQYSVRLARQQAAQAAGMHADLAANRPGLLTNRDVRRGNLRATLRAAQRRLVYLWLGHRMNPKS